MTDDDRLKQLNALAAKYAQQKLTNTTALGQPSWTSPTPIPVQMTAPDIDPRKIAETPISTGPLGRVIGVMQPNDFTPPVAAHESTHVFQNSLNPDFQKAMDANFTGIPTPSTYRYGLKDIISTGGKNIGSYNREQQAKMVEDLTDYQSQAMANPNPTKDQLQSWDTVKQALEHPIRQLINIPQKDDSLLGKIGLGQDSYLRNLLSPAPVQMPVPVAPEVPSLAMGNIQPSSLVRTVLAPPPKEILGKENATGEQVHSLDGGRSWSYVRTGKPYGK